MASRRRRSGKPMWMYVIGLAACCLIAGWIAGGVLGGNVMPRIPFLYHTPHGDDVAAMSRENLEREVHQLRNDLTTKNRQLDDLQVQVKLLSAGSHTAQ